MAAPGKPRFFATPATLDAWLAKHGAQRSEIAVGYWKVGTGRPSMTWAQSVEVALRYGWIDGVRHSLGAEAYTIRFTPRKPGSHWSRVNVRTATRLLREGRMTAAGAAAFAARRSDRTGRASYEQNKKARLGPADVKRFKADAAAWAWFSSAAPSYQRACRSWVQGAKRAETRTRRLDQIIAHARKGEVVPQYQWRKGPRPGTGARRKRQETAPTPKPRRRRLESL
ncbi:MAG TPA: YdeI/OmpD-associated family protein [Candidatus Thermoplasmatota archaeon]|nr:YdeI/OmpD-associated family protein [Candidatus Thermoplasmatota archaeon]